MGKTKKDPNAPKRPQSAYFLWLNANRALIKEENPGISITEISKKAGKMWGEMTAADKVVCAGFFKILYKLVLLILQK